MFSVFIGGHPRSGTTLLGALVGSHSKCICTPESHFRKLVYYRFNASGKSDKIDIRAAMELIKEHWRFKLWGINIDSMNYSEIRSHKDLILYFVRAYAEKTGKKNASIWVDHTPANMEYSNTLLELFPDAKLIHIVRDGRAVASSVIPLDWGANTVDRAALSWVKKVSHGLTIESLLGKERIMRVQYEDLIHDPEPILKEICNFLSIDYQPQMMKGKGFIVPKFQAEEHALVGKDLNVARVNAWERELTSRQIEIFESIAGDLLQSLGYPLKFGSRAKKMTAAERLISDIQEVCMRKVINRFRRHNRKKAIATT
jgi:hypothetical protein